MDSKNSIHSLRHFPDLEPAEYQTIKRELKIAKNIQTTLLNGKFPKMDHAEVVGTSKPARLVGGDYYDFYPLENGKVRIIIGDVMGKGIPAAMLMILTRGAFRSASESTGGPGATLTAMNKALTEDLRKLRSFVTVFCADWDAETNMLTFANAGHHLPIWVRNNEVIEFPETRGVMLGGLPGEIYKESRIKVQNKDIIFFYTDGIIEATNPENEQFSLQRLIDLLSVTNGSVEEIQDLVIQTIQAFTTGTPQRDDITMIVLKIVHDLTSPPKLNTTTTRWQE
jgi:sigma-B regulation protein RsbU (phosphoserine phosphatase)